MSDTHASFDDLWRAIVRLHNEVKGLFLLAEELELRRFRTFFQPISELRNAYEHLIRAKANEYGLDEEQNDIQYQQKSMRRTLGHEYRAFFDCADWLGVILRERIVDELRWFSNATIQSALPDYFSKYKVRIIEISEGIAEIRARKDISRERSVEPPECGPEVIDEIDGYKKALEELQAIHKAILSAMPALIEHRRKAVSSAAYEWGFKLIVAIASAVVGGLVVYWLTK